ncbi:MAG: ribonuclease HI family protein [Patescibacteria group bacterium]
MEFILYTDGGARNNPGPAGAGFVIQGKKGEIVATGKKYLGERTNNEAEYEALILGLKKALELEIKEIQVLMDSELVVRQMNRDYKVKDLELSKLFLKVWNLAGQFKKISYQHIPREKNTLADGLVNEVIDEGLEA